MADSVDNEESKGFNQTEYSFFDNDFEVDESDNDAKGNFLKRRVDHFKQLLVKKQAKTKQAKKSAAKDKARRDKHIALM